MAAACIALTALLAGCRGAPPAGFLLRPLVEAGQYAVGGSGGRGPLRFAARPALADLEVDHELRPVVLTAPAPWSWSGVLPPGAELHAGAQILPAAWQAVRRVELAVAVRRGREREIVQVAASRERADPRWLDLSADLGRYAGRQVTLEFSAFLAGLPVARRGANLVAWGPVAVTTGREDGKAAAAASDEAAAPAAAANGLSSAARRSPPNIVFIVVDTLRRDRLTPYGYGRDTSPEIAHRLAVPGTVVEEAYSQAPWTLPSVVSFMTGRYPGELLGSDLATYGIPAGVAPLAERLRRLGYETGGFLANPTLHVGAGFERGFRTFFAPPADIDWIGKHADELNRHAIPWVEAHQDRRFFLYVHYIDPHDPYDNPEVVGNLSPFETSYSGRVAGNWVHGIYSGKIRLDDPERDLAHLNALYDSEVHYADRFIGQLLGRIRPEVAANTLFVFTSDHGEELDDHAGWKHGQTLYDEQVHVPLIMRWDGQIPARQRLHGTVRLLDLLPTLLDAAGAGGAAAGAAEPEGEGIDLLPALTGRAPLRPRPAFIEGLSGGPLRAAAVLGNHKLILFNREEPFAPKDELQSYLWRHDLGRLARVELYDLARDPGERRNLLEGANPAPSAAAPGPAIQARLALLETVIDRRLDRALPGLWLLGDGLAPGAHLRGSLVFERPPRGWSPYFLGPRDRVEASAGRLRFELVGDVVTKGLRIEGDCGRLERIEAELDGRPLPPERVRIGAAASYSGGAVAPAALLARQWPGAQGAGEPAVLRLWIHDTSGEAERRTEADAETLRRLRNLGYIQ
ncbi:MAG TPA: sulfatase [Thermoanaerobaculia bacterium]|nr:sulfatase [Thermoanaerobaculia bacterium]